ncbi:MAG: DUF1887 family CARF protein [Polyangia bacterium]
MICLIGEQPIPNLLPILHFRPERILLFYTKLTKRRAENLAAVAAQRTHGLVDSFVVEPYDAASIYEVLNTSVGSRPGSELLVNLTGGTKPMMLAALQFAVARAAASLYFTSEAQLNEIFFFPCTTLPLPRIMPLPFDTTLDVSLHAAAFGRTPERPRQQGKNVCQEALEGAVAAALTAAVPEFFDEVVPGARFGLVEIDVIVRYRNQIAFCEVYHPDLDKKKARRPPGDTSPIHANLKQKLDQLSTASGRDYFGTYIKRCVIFAGSEDNMHPDYLTLSRAQSVHNIALDFPPGPAGQPLAAAERQKLIDELYKCLKPTPASS